jgi:hypothetical protein
MSIAALGNDGSNEFSNHSKRKSVRCSIWLLFPDEKSRGDFQQSNNASKVRFLNQWISQCVGVGIRLSYREDIVFKGAGGGRKDGL